MRVKNFRSFEDAEIGLRKFNILIGANASGKSNFVNVFRFLKDLFACGLDDAISMQGGVEYLRNVDIGTSKDLSIELCFAQDSGGSVPFRTKRKGDYLRFIPHEITYAISVGFSKTKPEYFVREEKLGSSFEIQKCVNPTKKEKWEFVEEGKILVSRDADGKIFSSLHPKTLPITIETIFPFPFLSAKSIEAPKAVSNETYLVGYTVFSPLFSSMRIFVDSLKIYSIDPKLSKKPSVITGKTELEADGSNLAVVLKHLLSDKKKKARFLNLVRDLLPFVRNTSISKLEDSSLFMFQEEDNIRQPLPAMLLSDGTIDIIALVTALFFGEEPLIIIEEPERNIHPSLISKLVDLIKDVSERMNRQIIVTTHNPEFVKNSRVENILLVSRNGKGFSKISNPSDKKEVQLFLKNEIGIEELFVQNLLGD